MVASNKLSVKFIIYGLDESSDLDRSAAEFLLKLHNCLEKNKQQLTMAKDQKILKQTFC